MELRTGLVPLADPQRSRRGASEDSPDRGRRLFGASSHQLVERHRGISLNTSGQPAFRGRSRRAPPSFRPGGRAGTCGAGARLGPRGRALRDELGRHPGLAHERYGDPVSARNELQALKATGQGHRFDPSLGNRINELFTLTDDRLDLHTRTLTIPSQARTRQRPTRRAVHGGRESRVGASAGKAADAEGVFAGNGRTPKRGRSSTR